MIDADRATTTAGGAQPNAQTPGAQPGRQTQPQGGGQNTPQETQAFAALGDEISKGEGSYKSYNSGTSNGHVIHSGIKENLLSMTIDQLIQSASLPATDTNRVFAAGKYQIITTTTLPGAKRSMHLSGSEPFNEAMQESIFRHYLIGPVKRPVIAAYLEHGRGSLEDAVYDASKEWASIEVPAGRPIRGGTISNGHVSYYESGANHARAGSGARIAARLQAARNSIVAAQNGGGRIPNSEPAPLVDEPPVSAPATGNTPPAHVAPHAPTANGPAPTAPGGEHPHAPGGAAPHAPTGAHGGHEFQHAPSLDDVAAGHGSIHKGMEGESVSFVQGKVGAHSDRKFGEHTETAVKHFQTAHQVPADGKVGQHTLQVMRGGHQAANNPSREQAGGSTPGVAPHVAPAGAGPAPTPHPAPAPTPHPAVTSGPAAPHTETPAPAPVTPAPAPSNASLGELMAKQRLTVAEIAQARLLIAREPAASRPALYESLQSKSQYLSQRANESKDAQGHYLGDVMCNLTSLSMCLEYLGVPNPHPEMAYPDALERIRVENHLGPRTDHGAIAAVAHKLGVSHRELSSGGAHNKAWWRTQVLTAIQGGSSILCSITGHICRVQDVTEQGLIADDPYGASTLGAGAKRGWAGANHNPHTGRGAAAGNVGEDHLWPWAQVEPHSFLFIWAMSHA
ncbi:MAG TPA: peptidoglycan-binding protein [Kofleriaceae bacterium]|jgi:muramidase (phage lysozyme)